MFYEIKQQMKSRIFYAFIIVLIIMMLTNYNANNTRLKPLEKDGYYGYTSTTVDEDVLYRGYELLHMAYLDKQVIRYIPLGTFTDLSESQLEELGDFLEKMAPNKDPFTVTRKDFQIDVTTMFKYMEKLDEQVGGKTYFSDQEYFYSKKMTYEEAIEARHQIKEQDDYTRAYARLFSDYFGIDAAFFVLFVVAFSMYRDIRTGQRELYYTSNTTALSYIGGKFCGLLCSIMSVFLLFALLETLLFAIQAIQYGEHIDLLAFLWTSFVWLTPTVMFCIAFPLLIYTVTNRFSLTVISQFAFSSYMLYTTSLSDDYGITRLIIRFNQLAPYEVFEPFAHSILINRIFYVVLSLVILGLTGYIWSFRKKRVLQSIDL